MTRFFPQPAKVSSLLQACFPYEATSLIEIKDENGNSIFVKNETARMGLGCFKGLGGIYAVAALIGEQWKQSGRDELVFQNYLKPEVRAFAKSLTFICASAGNHGLAVAKGAYLFGAKAKIYLSTQVPMDFENRLIASGASVVRKGETYEESCEAAKEDADKLRAILVADSSWTGYTFVPSLVMEGYTVLAEELRQAFEKMNVWPTHVYLQAGVGGMAAAITYMIRENWHCQPEIFIVEPRSAQCLSQSHAMGYITIAKGPKTNMERLDCKIPSLIAYDILEASNVNYISIVDHEAEQAVDYFQTLNIQTTPSGAAGLAGLRQSQILDTKTTNIKALVIVTEIAEYI